jgi:hypothetical protein
MAHFAQLNESNVVTQVIVVNNSDCGDLPFPESEPVGIAYIQTFLPGRSWKQTSYNGGFRKRYAGIGYIYSEEYDAFFPPKPYDDWVFSVDDLKYVPPVPRPNDGGLYTWDQDTHQWVSVKVPVTVIGE